MNDPFSPHPPPGTKYLCKSPSPPALPIPPSPYPLDNQPKKSQAPGEKVASGARRVRGPVRNIGAEHTEYLRDLGVESVLSTEVTEKLPKEGKILARHEGATNSCYSLLLSALCPLLAAFCSLPGHSFRTKSAKSRSRATRGLKRRRSREFAPSESAREGSS